MDLSKRSPSHQTSCIFDKACLFDSTPGRIRRIQGLEPCNEKPSIGHGFDKTFGTTIFPTSVGQSNPAALRTCQTTLHPANDPKVGKASEKLPPKLGPTLDPNLRLPMALLTVKNTAKKDLRFD